MLFIQVNTVSSSTHINSMLFLINQQPISCKSIIKILNFTHQQTTEISLFAHITLLCFCKSVLRTILAYYFFSGCVSCLFILFTKFSKMSKTSIKERSRTEITQVVYIPPLKLPDYFQNSPKLHKTKETLAFLQPLALDKNSDFLKEKSLYRYAISRKLNRFQDSKSSLNLSTGTQGLQKSKEKDGECSIKRQNSKQGCLHVKLQQSQEERQRHFKRRNRNQFQKSHNQIPSISMAANQNENVIYYQKTNNIALNSQNNGFLLEPERIQVLKRNNQSLAKQNQNMKELLRQKNKQLQNYQDQIKVLKKENEKLLSEVHRNINLHSESFINDQKIENQIRLRDTIIDQLQSSIKYIELQNLTLKKAKTECNRQANVIIKLERENKILQEKIKKLYKQKTKRRNMKGSLISECSDLSLNLSFDQQDSEKRIQVLKTSQRTPQKVRNSQNYSGNSVNTASLELLSRGFKIKSPK